MLMHDKSNKEKILKTLNELFFKSEFTIKQVAKIGHTSYYEVRKIIRKMKKECKIIEVGGSGCVGDSLKFKLE